MHLHTIDWLLIALYGLFLIVIIGKSGKKDVSTIEGFLLAGRHLTLPSFVATTVSTWYGGILGVGEYSYKFGISNWLVFGVPYYLGAFLFAMLLSRRANQSRLMTIPDQMNSVYGQRLGIFSAGYVYVMTVPAAYVLMNGVLIKMLFGVSLESAVFIGAAITTAYVFLGGFKADVRSDWVNFTLMFLSFAIMLVLLVVKFGPIEYLVKHVPATHFQWHGGNTTGYIFSWYLIALAALIEPSFFQRAYAANDPATARKGILISIPFWCLFDFMTTSVGLYSRALLGDNIEGVNAFPLIADLVLPVGLKALFVIGMFATIQSTVDSYTLLSASTLSHDILWKFKRIRYYFHEVWLTRIAIILSAAVACVIGLTSGSAIDIWNRIGSLGTPGLMLPLALSYHPRLAYRKAWAAATMTVAPLFVGISFLIRDRMPAPTFPFSIEPIYIGLGLAVTLLALDHLTRPRVRPGESLSDKTL